LLAALAITALAGLEAGYRWVLRDFSVLPAPLAVPGREELAYAWRELGGVGPIRGEVLYPWNFGRLRDLDSSWPSLKAAHYVAQFHIAVLRDEGRLDNTSRSRDALRQRALIIWLSRHWSAEQLVGWTYTATVLPNPHRMRKAK
jgi:hypothetical protein